MLQYRQSIRYPYQIHGKSLHKKHQPYSAYVPHEKGQPGNASPVSGSEHSERTPNFESPTRGLPRGQLDCTRVLSSFVYQGEREQRDPPPNPTCLQILQGMAPEHHLKPHSGYISGCEAPGELGLRTRPKSVKSYKEEVRCDNWDKSLDGAAVDRKSGRQVRKQRLPDSGNQDTSGILPDDNLHKLAGRASQDYSIAIGRGDISGTHPVCRFMRRISSLPSAAKLLGLTVRSSGMEKSIIPLGISFLSVPGAPTLRRVGGV